MTILPFTHFPTRPSARRILWVAVLCLLGLARGFAQVDHSRTLRDIETHREWVKTHVPKADTLTDESLLWAALDAIGVSAVEEEYAEVIRQAGRRFGLAELERYADMRSTRAIDRADSMAIVCMERLYGQAEATCGSPSYTAAYTAMMLAAMATNEESTNRWEDTFIRLSEALYEADPSDRNREMWFLGRLQRLFHDEKAENPTHYEAFRRLSAEIFAFDAKHHSRTMVMHQIYNILYYYLLNGFQTYNNYYAVVNQQLVKDSLPYTTRNALFPGEGLEGELTAQDLTRRRIDILKNQFHAAHPDVLNGEAFYLKEQAAASNGTTDDSPLYNRLKEILDYQETYYPYVTPITLDTRNYIRDYEARHQTNLFHARKYQDDLDEASKWFPAEKFVEYRLNTLCSEFQRQITLDLDNATDLVKEICELSDRHLKDKPLEYLNYRLYAITLQRQGVRGYENSFQDMVGQYLAYADTLTRPGWESVGLGKMLVQYSTYYFNDIPTALRLHRSVLLQMEKLVPRTSPLFAFDYIEYVQRAGNQFPVLTLDGKDDKEALFKDVMACAEGHPGTAASAHLCAADYLLAQHRHEEANRLLHKSLGLTGDLPEGSQKSFRIGICTGLLQSFSCEGNEKDSVRFYAHELEALTKDMPKEEAYGHTNTLQTLAEYYMNTEKYGEAKAWMERCLALYDENYIDKMDGSYIQLLTMLVTYYANVENDLNKCLELTQQAEAAVNSIKDLGSYETYIGLLRITYDLIEAKTPYDNVMLNKYENLLGEHIYKYYAASNYNPSVWLNHVLYLRTKHVNKANREAAQRNMFIAQNREEQFETEWQAYRQNVVLYTIPELLAMKAYMDSVHYENSMWYQQALQALALAFDKCADNPSEAETYYKLLAQKNEYGGKLMLGGFYLLHNQPQKAVEAYKNLDLQFRDAMGKLGENSDSFSNIRLNVSCMFCMAYYFNGDYEDALRHAEEFQRSVQTHISKNFDLFTQNERETFVNTIGAGGMFLQLLLPQMPERLSEPVYNSVLQEKGLLLRSSERMRRAILASGKQELIQALDSISLLNQRISTLEQDKLLTPEGQAEMLGLRETLDRLERYVAREAEPYRKDEAVPDWRAVRDRLRKGEAAVEFVVTDSATMALVLTPKCEKPQYVRLLGPADMQRIANMFNAADQSQVAIDLYEHDREQLYRRLWQPMEPLFAGAKTIYFSPSGYLNALSFAAFPTGEGDYLIDRYDLHQLTSTAQLVKRSGKKRPRSRSARLYGAIFYNDRQQAEYGPLLEKLAAEAPAPDPTRQRKAAYVTPFPFLESTPYELTRIGRSFAQSGIATTVVEGSRSTEAAFRSNSGDSPDILHISTHGFFYPTTEKALAIPYFRKYSQFSPMNCSGLALASAEDTWQGADLPLEQDNILTSNEISSLNLDGTRLVVLSACETALGGIGRDGVFGLQRGFKQAGVASICASLWSVNDASTSALMQRFYHHWLSEGDTMQAAMKKAMTEQRRETPSPCNWAPFVLLDADL